MLLRVAAAVQCPARTRDLARCAAGNQKMLLTVARLLKLRTPFNERSYAQVCRGVRVIDQVVLAVA